MKKVVIPLAPGFEEIEALAVVDILRRAGVEVTMAGTEGGPQNPIEGRSGIKVLADTTLDEVVDKDFDVIVLPGGALGTENLKKDKRVAAMVERIFKEGGFTTAICAAPTVLSAIGVTKGRRITSHPGVREELTGETYSDDRVVVDGNIITSRAPGTAIEFALTLVEALLGKDKAREVNAGVLARVD